MNRQQQRAAQKINRRQSQPSKGKRREIDKAAAWYAIQAKIYSASIDPHTEGETIEVLQTVYPAMLRLSKGLFDLADFKQMNLINAFGYELTSSIYQAGDDETKQAVIPGNEIFLNCADALLRMGERFNKLKKFGATGDEIQALRSMISFVEQIMNVATRGLVLSALTRAEASVRKAEKNSLMNREEVH